MYFHLILSPSSGGANEPPAGGRLRAEGWTLHSHDGQREGRPSVDGTDAAPMAQRFTASACTLL